MNLNKKEFVSKFFRKWIKMMSHTFLAKWTGEQNVDASEVFVRWENQKHNSICGFRNEQFRSIYTGHLAPPVPTKWTEDMS